jgi:23S rRNA (adenine2503-C2)-methyltransferase
MGILENHASGGGESAAASLRRSDPRGTAAFGPGAGLDDVRARLRGTGAKSAHERQVLRAWTQSLPLDAGPRRAADFLPRRLRDALPAVAEDLAGLARLSSRHDGADGSARLLVELADGESVECVLLPGEALCASTQAGCAVGCLFCATGRAGLRRQLGSAEIVAQVALARSLAAVRKVVFMGMGEPAHNLDQVMEAIEWLGTEGEIAHKNLVFSTVGDLRVFERLPRGRVKPALALSLHSTFAARRAELMPHAPRIDPAELVLRAERYARATHYPIQYQWTLLAGVNDTDEEVEGIVRLLAGKYAVMNLIPYNTVDGPAFARPTVERAAAMAQRLNGRGVLAKLRQSAGQDVEGGCGQLRAREMLMRRPPAT